LYTDKIPDSAACNEAVKLAKKHGFTSLSGFVNGVLRAIAKNKDSIQYLDESKNPVQYLSVRYSYSEEIIRYWLETLAYSDVKALCEAGGNAPAVSLAVNTVKTTAVELKTMLENAGMTVSGGNLNPNSLIVKKTNDISSIKAYTDGLFHIMDESSALAVRVLNPAQNSAVLDVCAAPGGKSLAAAYIMQNMGSIVSRDLYPHKTELIQNAANRTGIDIITVQTANALDNEDIEKYDYVIVDAPCSGLGLVRKKPDIKYNKTRADISELARIQRDILTATQKSVKKGGYLLYSTCTVSVEENEKNAKWFADNFDFEPIDISEYLPDEYKEQGKNGMVQILTGQYNSDGFFISKFRKK
jgi:16S rRNA (cytosine967-C5)-methyltransferase